MRLIKYFANAIFIKPRLDLEQWAKTYRVLSQESSALFGKFSPLPYQIEPMRAISDEKIPEIVLMWASQLGKSEILNNTIGYYIHQNPSTILFLLPTEDNAEDYSKRRLTPMFRDTKVLSDLINAREANNTILIKNFKGGNLALVGSNSPSKLASKPIKVLLVDEVDRCEKTKEGHSIDLAQKRTNTFYDRKIIKVSTPTLKDNSVIENEYLSSDKRKYIVPCPFCNDYQSLEFENIVYNFENNIISDVFYQCQNCGSLLDEVAKNKAVNNGKWIITNPNSKKAGFFLNAIYSPFFKMSDIIKDFLESKDNPSRYQVFVNTILAKTYEPPSVRFEDAELYNRREEYTPTSLSNDVIFITSGVDVQADRLEIEFKAWGLGFENWGVEYVILRGDTKENQVWQNAYNTLKKVFYTKNGRALRSSITLVDSGYNIQKVAMFVKLDKRFFMSKGASEGESKRDFISTPRKYDKHCFLYMIGTYKGKNELFSLLKVNEAGAGYCHYPTSYNMEYFRQLSAEKLNKIKKDNGYIAYQWQKIRDRNEALDISVLCLAGAKILKLDSFNIQKIVKNT